LRLEALLEARCGALRLEHSRASPTPNQPDLFPAARPDDARALLRDLNVERVVLENPLVLAPRTRAALCSIANSVGAPVVASAAVE